MVRTLADIVDERCREEENCDTETFCHIVMKPNVGNQLARLQYMSLDHSSIDSLSGASLLAKHCPVLTDLDLSHNKLTSWSEVISLFGALPTLKLLNVGFNPFEKTLPSSSSDDTGASSLTESDLASSGGASKHAGQKGAGIRTLILNGTYCPWHVVRHLTSQCPSLEELHLSCNDYADVELSDLSHSCVQRLHFNNNLVTSWHTLEKLGVAFPQLKMVMVRANPLNIQDAASGDAASCESLPMASVSEIVLSETRISSIDELFILQQKCPSMKEIRLTDVPLVSALPEDVQRDVVIACMPQLKRLNGSLISSDEIEKAERVFVRHYRPCKDMSQPLRAVYDNLVERHGLLEPLRNIDLGLPKKKATLKVTWFYDEMEEHAQHPPILICVSLKSSFLSLKHHAGKILGIEERLAARMAMYYKDGDDDTWTRLYGEPELPLYKLFIEDNGDILVKKPAPTQKNTNA